MTVDLAGRGTRLGATLIDSLISLPGQILIWMGAGMLGHEGDFASMITDPSSIPVFSPPTEGLPFLIVLGFIWLFAVSIVPFWWLITRGQTIGKRILGIKIVRMDTGKNGGFVTNILRRIILFLFVAWLVGLAPFFLAAFLGLKGLLGFFVASLGLLFFPANFLFIFSKDKRCIHDHVAGTQVVKA